MESIPTDAFVPSGAREWIPLCHWRHRAMEARVKTGKLGHLRVTSPNGLNERESLGHMGHVDRFQAMQVSEQCRGDPLRPPVIGSPMHDAMSDRFGREGDMFFTFVERHAQRRIEVRYVAGLIRRRFHPHHPYTGPLPADAFDGCCEAAA